MILSKTCMKSAFILIIFVQRLIFIHDGFIPQIEGSDLDSIEACVIDAFVSLVFKLSESQFKPMLIQVSPFLF